MAQICWGKDSLHPADGSLFVRTGSLEDTPGPAARRPSLLPSVVVGSGAAGEKSHSWWRHQMETFSALQALCVGNSPGEFPAQRPVTRSLMFSFICAWISGWVNNREAGDLRRHCAHYDVIVMTQLIASKILTTDTHSFSSIAITNNSTHINDNHHIMIIVNISHGSSSRVISVRCLIRIAKWWS